MEGPGGQKSPRRAAARGGGESVIPAALLWRRGTVLEAATSHGSASFGAVSPVSC